MKLPSILLEGQSRFDLSKVFGSGTLESGGVSAVTNAAAVVSGVAGGLVSSVLLVMLVLFLLMSPEPIFKSLLGGIPLQSRPVVEIRNTCATDEQQRDRNDDTTANEGTQTAPPVRR